MALEGHAPDGRFGLVLLVIFDVRWRLGQVTGCDVADSACKRGLSWLLRQWILESSFALQEEVTLLSSCLKGPGLGRQGHV